MNRIIIMIFMLISLQVSFAVKVGYIDFQKVFNEYQKTMAIQADMQVKEEMYRNLLAEKQKEIELAKKKHKDSSEIKEIVIKLQEELEPQKRELLGLNAQYSQEIHDDIVNKVKEVADIISLDIVLDKQVVIHGGHDITNIVLSKLNN